MAVTIAARIAASLLSPAGPRARLLILMYHRVLPRPDPFAPDEIDVDQFDGQMRLLRRRFTPLSLADALQHASDATLPARAVCVTFDDGYRDNHDVALPVLERHGVPATFFVATGYSNGGSMFNDIILNSLRETRKDALELESFGLGRRDLGAPAQRRALADELVLACKFLPSDERLERARGLARAADVQPPGELMMGHEQIRALAAAGMEIGGHTHTHPILTSLAPEAAFEDIDSGRRNLEAIVDRPVRFFAYPNGKPQRDYASEHVELVRRAGFEAALSTAWGAVRPDSDRFQLPRIAPWDRTPARFALRMVKTYVDGPAATLTARAAPVDRGVDMAT